MAAEDISEGLRIAMSKGESLQSAIQSFYNAGYPHDQVQAAASSINQSGNIPQQNFQNPQTETENNINSANIEMPDVPVSPPDSQQPTKQQVSSYGDEAKNPRRLMITLIVVMLIIFGTILAGLFFFREQVINFLEGIIS